MASFSTLNPSEQARENSSQSYLGKLSNFSNLSRTPCDYFDGWLKLPMTFTILQCAYSILMLIIWSKVLFFIPPPPFQEADLAAAPVTISEVRKKVVDFTEPFMNITTTVLVHRPKTGMDPPISTVKDLANQNDIQYGLIKNGMTQVGIVKCVQLSLFQTSSMASGHHGDSWTNKPAMCDDLVSLLSDH